MVPTVGPGPGIRIARAGKGPGLWPGARLFLQIVIVAALLALAAVLAKMFPW